MKYLQDYREDAQTALFDSTGSFFAFSMKQFNEAKKDGVKYTNCGAGLICDSRHVTELVDGLDAINKAAIKQDLTDNGKRNIIIRELYNHEAFYTCDVADTFDAVKQYGFTKDEIYKIYLKEKSTIDWDNF